MTNAPIWLLDVDGVLNAVCKKPNPKVWPDFEVSRAMGFNITYSPTVIRKIDEWHESGLVEVRWLTTWEDMANVELDVGFTHEFEVAGYSREFPGDRWWKLGVAKRVWDEGRSIVWTDDDIRFDGEAKEWAHALHTSHRLLAISPKTEAGLTPAHMDVIEEFLWRFKER